MKRDRTSKCDKTLQGGERGKKAEKYILKLNNMIPSIKARI